MEFIYFLVGLVLGAIVISLILKIKKGQSENIFLAEKMELEKQQSLAEERLRLAQTENSTLSEDVKTLRQTNEQQGQRLARAEVEFRNLQEKLTTQKQEMEELQKKFTTEFENVATRILKKNSAEFVETNQKNINDILSPLKEKIQLFEKKVEETYEKGLKDQTDLKAELKKLHDLNEKISDDARNLTKALKSDSKTQGNWGELVLERILERSGLQKDREYRTQVTDKNQEGEIIKPDVVILLPDQKHIIIDSKVSLTAYEKYVNAGNEADAEQALKEHIVSLKSHIKGLGEKHYPTAKSLNAPDFVLMFLPIESSFGVAVEEDKEIFNFAWERNIVVVSPSTLLATLRTIASIWKQENQTRNALEIARQGGALYDKFVGFIGDMERIGSSLDTTRKNFDAAMNKLNDGRGNLIRSAEKLKELGSKTTREIPKELLDNE